ncbi:MAG: hypothetical protein VX798_00890 [Bacteroidota bacterium]|uniref:Uncharacterized protein n=1 Tax=Flagellimonas profundi TaxID=2915620 RepID=A0ABS3FHZ2_9FLAO|nr:hypothetical protein [Allomuricauda profundi]MBO0342668.1 hypothetical protein [Allomuricauda profundi]MEC7769707.1 hypothetical protein [Bacteroidota bacterium]
MSIHLKHIIPPFIVSTFLLLLGLSLELSNKHSKDTSISLEFEHPDNQDDSKPETVNDVVDFKLLMEQVLMAKFGLSEKQYQLIRIHGPTFPIDWDFQTNTNIGIHRITLI